MFAVLRVWGGEREFVQRLSWVVRVFVGFVQGVFGVCLRFVHGFARFFFRVLNFTSNTTSCPTTERARAAHANKHQNGKPHVN